MRPGQRMWTPHGSGSMQTTCTALALAGCTSASAICLAYNSIRPCAYTRQRHRITASFITRPGSIHHFSTCLVQLQHPNSRGRLVLREHHSRFLNLSKNNNFKFLGLTVFVLDFHFLKTIILITCKRTTCRGCFRPSSVSEAIQLYRLNSYGPCYKVVNIIIECMSIREQFQVILNLTHLARFKQI